MSEPDFVQEVTATRQHIRLGFWVEGPGLGHAADANLRLIAAAPDLLAALREIETWLLHSHERSAQAALRLARAAIARAEGGAP